MVADSFGYQKLFFSYRLCSHKAQCTSLFFFAARWETAIADRNFERNYMSKDGFFWQERAKKKGRGGPLLLFLLLLLLLSALVACATPAPETERQRLENRIESVRVDRCETVVECFQKWRLPKGYDAKKIDEAEQKLHENFYQQLEVAPLAKAAAEAFMALYYDSVSFSESAAYTDALLRCLVFATDDAYAVYRTAEEYQEYVLSMSGAIGGIGITVRKAYDTGVVTVIRVIDGSPAARAGILAGDILHSVEGTVITKETMDAAFEKMQGNVGDAVRFTVLRGGAQIPFHIVRENLENLTVSYTMLEGNIAFISVTSFKASTFEFFKKAVDAAEAAGAVGFIFDMRDNPGGYLSAVWSALDYIAPKDTELFSYGVKDDVTAYFSDDSHCITVPCVVLCNGSTASAGELFTSALRDFNDFGILKTTVLGTEKATYGKGIMQGSYRLADGSYITMTTAYYNPPCGVNYHGFGVKPHRVCADSEIMQAAIEELRLLIAKN